VSGGWIRVGFRDGDADAEGLAPSQHSVDHDVGQGVTPLPPRPHALGVVLQLGVPLFRPDAVLGLRINKAALNVFD